MLEQSKNWEIEEKMNHLKQEKQPTLVSITLKPGSMRIRLIYCLIWKAPFPFQITHFFERTWTALGLVYE